MWLAANFSPVLAEPKTKQDIISLTVANEPEPRPDAPLSLLSGAVQHAPHNLVHPRRRHVFLVSPVQAAAKSPCAASDNFGPQRPHACADPVRTSDLFHEDSSTADDNVDATQAGSSASAVSEDEGLEPTRALNSGHGDHSLGHQDSVPLVSLHVYLHSLNADSLFKILIRITNKRPDSQDPKEIIKTHWFETRGTSAIQHPPDFVQDELTLGDLFYHRQITHSKKSQLWFWIDDQGTGPYWKPVNIGYQRKDGRRLTLSEKRKTPSWVRSEYYVRRGAESRCVT